MELAGVAHGSVSMSMAQPTASIESELVERVIDGSDTSWSEFLERAHPAVLDICRRRRLGSGLAGRDDIYSEVALRTMERLRSNGFAALRRYIDTREKYPATSFVRWLSAVVANVFIDTLRSQPEYQRRRQAAARKLVKLQIVPLDDGRTARTTRDVQSRVELRRILAAMLDEEFPAEQRRALLLWLHGNTAAEIAEELSLSGSKQANKLLHAARQRLRRVFESGSR